MDIEKVSNWSELKFSGPATRLAKMSAESPNHSRPELISVTQNVVTPQPVTDPTILDSVAGFINEVVPTTGNDSFDSKDQIQWARFENLDWDESNLSPKSESPLPSSLILVLGYTTGVQVWAIPANGEALELFSWRHGSVKVLRILPAPYEVCAVNKRDLFESKRPLIALVDVATHGSAAGSLNFYSLKTGEQVKQIKFKNQILDVLANRRSVVITFGEKIAVFDAFTLEDKLSVTACYLSPGIQPNPVALGPRWLAFAEKKLITSRRSSGGNEGEGVQSYTATVLHAAKSLGRGLRELGDAVASSLTGNQSNKLGTSPNSPQAGGTADVPQKGIVTILDIENPTTQNADGSFHSESVVAHFIAHTEAIVCLQFGPCGMLLLTADKRGHDFNLFRINPHPVGSALAAVHHLYTLHRGDTSARVQDMCFSFDSRWVTVSTLRGTTHVFPITPYGGNIGVRTHTTPHVVNKMSRFHRSAGLNVEGRSNSPVSMYDSPVSSNFPYHNPRFSPFPHPTVVNPLAQLRQPVYMQNIGSTAPRQGRQRLSSSSEDNIALRVTACFAPARAWIDSTPLPRESGLNKNVKPVESLFAMNCHGTLVQYDLEPHHANCIPKDRICDDTPIELSVTAKAQWRLQRQPTSIDRPLPLPHQSLIFVGSTIPVIKKKIENGNDDDWLSQVEIITHAGPHRRLWMGPQFTFKTYTTTNGTPMSLADAQPLDLNRSKPVNMPITKANAVLIESSSASSSEQSLLDIYRKNCEEIGAAGEHQIKEDLADAMIESPGAREAGGRCVLVSMKTQTPLHRATSAPPPIAKVVNPLGTVVTVQSDDESDIVIPEDIIIYENCDETLFRPLVSPKTLAYCRSSKADSGNIMMQSLRGDTEVTVRVMDRTEGNLGQPSSWEDPKFQDIKNNTKVLVKEGAVRDLMVQREVGKTSERKIESNNGKVRNKEQNNGGTTGNISIRKSPEKDESNKNGDVKAKKSTPKDISERENVKSHKNKSIKSEITRLKETSPSESAKTDINISVRVNPEYDKAKKSQTVPSFQSSEISEHCLKLSTGLEGVNSKRYDSDSRSSSERESSKNSTTSSSKSKVGKKVTKIENMEQPEFEETSYGLVNPLYNALEGSELIKVDRSTSKGKNIKSDLNTIQKTKPSLEGPDSFIVPDFAGKSKSIGKKSVEDYKDVPDSVTNLLKAEIKSKAVYTVADIKPDVIEVDKELDNKQIGNKASNRAKRKGVTRNESSLINIEEKDDKHLKTTSSLLKDLDAVGEISFPALDSNLVNTDFPPLEENFFSLENLTKTEKFEDAQDCGLPLESIETFFSEDSCNKILDTRDEFKLLRAEPAEQISSDTVSTSEDNIFDEKDESSRKKSSSKKPRKPKAKLGIKIGSAGKEESPERSYVKSSNPEQSYSEVSAEVTLPVPKRSWSSIAAAPVKPSDAVQNDPWSNNNNNNEPAIKTDPVETYTITLPKKPYATVTTEKLLDIDTPEERKELSNALTDNLLDIDRSERSSPSEKGQQPSGYSPDLLKLSDKSSDDEKNESGSSPVETETTESSDEGKVTETVINTIEDKGNVAVGITTKPGAKRRVKKKKK